MRTIEPMGLLGKIEQVLLKIYRHLIAFICIARHGLPASHYLHVVMVSDDMPVQRVWIDRATLNGLTLAKIFAAQPWSA